MSRTWGLEDIVAKEGRDLRIINLLGAFAIGKISIAIMDRLHPSKPGASRDEIAIHEFRKRHTVANLLFFPVLFFFYGLYYTDILSTLSVLMAYLFFLKKQPVWTLIAGLVSLWFRQTNVFWVGLYLGALELRRSLLARISEKDGGKKDVSPVSELHDPLVADASFYGKNSFASHLVKPVEIGNGSLFCRLPEVHRIYHQCGHERSIRSIEELLAVFQHSFWIYSVRSLERRSGAW